MRKNASYDNLLSAVDNKLLAHTVETITRLRCMTLMQRQLQKFGLSEKEAEVYLALLAFDAANATDIAKKSGINRSTVYVLLEALKRRGLVSIAGGKETSVLLFTAASPERLKHMAEESVRRADELAGIAKAIMPELRSMHKGTRKKPRVRYFEGIEGLVTAYEDTLTAKETIRAFASIRDMRMTLPDYFPGYALRRTYKGIRIRSIHPDTPEARAHLQEVTEEDREAVLVPADTYDFSPEINMYDNKIVFLSFVETFALIIESDELAQAFKKVFELSWKEAARCDTTSRQ